MNIYYIEHLRIIIKITVHDLVVKFVINNEKLY